MNRVPTVFVENHRVQGLDANDPIRISYREKVGDEPTGSECPYLLKLQADGQHSGTIMNGISRIGYITGGKAACWKDEEQAEIITRHAVNFIQENRSQPFFLYLATLDIHAPRFPNPRFMKDSQLSYRGGSIAELDWIVGEVFAELKKSNLDDDTLVIFSSDNAARPATAMWRNRSPAIASTARCAD